MSIVAGFIAGSITVVLGAAGLASFALWLATRQARQYEQRRASHSVIIRVNGGYRARR